MAILMISDASTDTVAHYDELIRELEGAGQGNPAGRLHHVTALKGDGFVIVDVWESQEDFERFGQILGPIMQQVGSPPVPLEFYPVHNMINGA